MTEIVATVAAALALALAVYGALAGITWLRRFSGERKTRRQAMALNLIRRALPPAAAGLVLLVVARLVVAPGAGGLAALLIAGGLAFGFHQGLADLGQKDRRSILLRLAITAAVTPFLLWQLGVIAA